jgi:uncharacterized protein involved in exopolysaccharide biosynthesis
MVDQSPPFAPDRDASEEGEPEGFDVERVREFGGFVLHAARRRPMVALTTFVTVAAIGLVVAAAMPKTYVAEVKLLAQRGSAIRILSSQNQQMDAVDNPTKNVSAMIMRRDNLVALAKDTDLVSRFEATRPALLRLRDRWAAKFLGSVSDEDKLLAMVFTLEKQLEVTTTDDTTVNISVEWSNPRIAYDLVTLVQKNFLEARYDGDVAVINDSIGVLEDHAKTELANVDKELAEYQKIVDDRASRTAAAKAAGRAIPTVTPRGPATTGPRPMAASAAAASDPEITKELEQKRARIRAVEEAQQRTLEGLKQQLLQAQLTLTPMHPTVIGLQQQIEAASQPSPELAQLRNEEHSLMDELVPPRAAPPPPAGPGPMGGPLSLPGSPFGRAPSAADAGAAEGLALLLPPMSEEHDGQLQLAATELGSAIRAYQDVLGRIDGAKVELDITRAAYKHRYTVVTPAEVPRSPKKRSARAIGAGAVIGAALLALLLVTALDLAGGLVLESWQVRRRLKLEVLGELDKPS